MKLGDQLIANPAARAENSRWKRWWDRTLMEVGKHQTDVLSSVTGMSVYPKSCPHESWMSSVGFSWFDKSRHPSGTILFTEFLPVSCLGTFLWSMS